MIDIIGTFFTVLAGAFGVAAFAATSLPYLVLATVFLGIGFIFFDVRNTNA